MKLSKINKPRILLVGIGHFGTHHLRDLQEISNKGGIEFVGVVIHSEKGKKKAQDVGVKFFDTLTDDLLKHVDAVDIVTPPSTHKDLVKKCLKFTNVFLEKPIALSTEDGLELHGIANKERRILFLGHIYRFHPSIIKLKEIIKNSSTKPYSVECVLGDTPEKVTRDCGVLYSDLHGFDIIDYLFEEVPNIISAKGEKMREDSNFEDDVETILEYPSGLQGRVRLSWNMSPKVRKVSVYFSDKIIYVDLILQEIVIEKDKTKEKIKVLEEMPLMVELDYFVKVLKGEKTEYPNGLLGTRIVNIAAHAEKSMRENIEIKYEDI